MAEVIRDLSFADYLRSPGVSSSLLRAFDKSPLHGRHRELSPDAPTPAKTIGSAGHCMILEPAAFDRRYIAAPPCDRRTKDGKAAWAYVESQANGREILTHDHSESARRIAAAVHSRRDVAALLARLDFREVSIFWTDETTGLPLKARLDGLTIESNVADVADIKSAADISERAFSGAIAGYGYSVQAAFYIRAVEAAFGVAVRNFTFVAVESAEPYDCGLLDLGLISRNEGERKVAKLLRIVADCRKSDRYPGQHPERRTVEMPAWAFPDDVNMEGME